MESWEKLGVFYLGREIDETGETGPTPLLYESKDLTTHAVALGMTGSGKTGLCLSLLEEAALDKIPGILIDPKGDLGNLMLTFPELRASDFRPWIDESEAMRKGLSPDEYAKKISTMWRNGLASWGEDGDRIRRLRESADVSIYTPGGSAGLQLRVLKSFEAPPPGANLTDEALRERVDGSVTSLLVLLGIDPDPVQSREYILMSNLLERAWREGRNLDLAGLIREVQQPPFDRVGILDLESFFPEKERFALAMRLNAVLASPGFAPWMEGEPLDVDALLRTPAGKPRLSILSIAHLDEKERMFFVTLLLHEMVSWMRRQGGTTSLRAILYMDEVFGYFPPSAEPPSKRPMLTLLKQARAYGLGVVLSTQNPVDLDYKGLSNTGTWFLGRLQTERDKKRVLDGLETVSATSGMSVDRGDLEKRLSGLKSREFLMHNVHDGAPVQFGTRWAMSYLRGPLTSAQISTLMKERKAAVAAGNAAAAAGSPGAAPVTRTGASATAVASRPVLPPGIEEAFLPSDGSGGDGPLIYRPALLAVASLHHANSPLAVEQWSEHARLAVMDGDPGANPWPGAQAVAFAAADLLPEPEGDGAYEPVPAGALKKTAYTTWKKSFASYLYRECALTLFRSRDPKAVARPDESEGAFRARVAQQLQEKKDLTLEKLRARYATKFERLQERIRRDEQRVGKEKEQQKQQKFQTAVSVGATVLGALFGRKASTVGRASTALRGAGRISREAGDVQRAMETLETNRAKLAELEIALEDEMDKLTDSFDAESLVLESVVVRPRKADTRVAHLSLVWTPWRGDRPDWTSSV